MIVLAAFLSAAPAVETFAAAESRKSETTHCGKAIADYVLKRFAIERKLTTNYQRLSDEPVASLRRLRLAFEDHGLAVDSYRIEDSDRGRNLLRHLLAQCNDGQSQAVLLMPPADTGAESEGHYFAISGCDDELLDLVDPGNGLSYSVKFSEMQSRGFQPVVQLVSAPTSIWSRSIGSWEALVLFLSLSLVVGATFKVLSSRQG